MIYDALGDKSHVLIAPVTPMTRDGTLAIDAIPHLSKLLLARGATGFYLTGGTGEGMLLSVRERMEVVERWRDAVGERVPLVVHVGCVAPAESRHLAEHAEELGVAAISAIAPPVYVAADVRQLVASFAELTQAAPETPFFYYHNSAAAGPKLSGYDFLTAAADALPTLAGIKFTHEDLYDLSRCLRLEDGRYRIFYGKDEFLLGAHAVGATDFIGGSFNVVSPLVTQALRAFGAGNIDAARAAHHRIVDVIGVLKAFGGLSAVKATLSLLGVECGPTRLPLRPVLASARPALLEALERVWPEIVTARATDVVANRVAEPVA